MPLISITVTYGTSGLVNPDGSPAEGTITLQPVQETPDAGYTVVSSPRTFVLSAGQIAAPNTIDTNGQVGLQAMVYEQITGARNPPPYVVAIPTAGTLDLSVAERGTVGVTTPLYVPESTLGIPSGVATLGSDGVLTASQRPAAGAGTVTSVAAADATIVIDGTPTTAPTVRVGTIAESQVAGLVTDLAAKIPASTVTTKGDLLVATGADTVARLGVGSDAQVLTADSTQAGGVRWGTSNAYKTTVRKAALTSGDLNPPPNTGGGWQLTSFELDIPASAGDAVLFSFDAMVESSNNTFYDVALVVGSSAVYYLGSESPTPLTEGDPGWYPVGGFLPHPGPLPVLLTSGLIDSGNARFVLAVKSNGTGVLYADTTYPFKWWAINFGGHN